MIANQLLSLLTVVASQVTTAFAECWRDTTCDGPEEPSFTGPWEKNAVAPTSRTLSPKHILDANHNNLDDFPSADHATLKNNGSLLVFDWGFEVGGVVTVEYTAQGDAGSLGIAFSEASNFTGYMSDESNGGTGHDGALRADINIGEPGETHKYVVPDRLARGGFRYLSLYTLTNSSVEVSVKTMTVELSFHPNWGNLRAYGGYFHSSDDLLNKIWYASAYTLQTNYMATNTARVYPCLDKGWDNSADLHTKGVGLAAGNKRDRAVWAGDFGQSIRSGAISLGDMGTLKRTLSLLFDVQKDTGETPWVAPPIDIFGSDAYHMATLMSTSDYMLYTGDMDWLHEYWNQYKAGVAFVTQKIDETGMMNVTGANNWGRTAMSSGHTSDGNMLLYGALTTGAQMAGWMNDTIGKNWTDLAEKVKESVIKHNWDNAAGALWNSDADSSNHCEDGNSMAILYGAMDSDHASSISDYLTTMWTPIGAEAGELPGSIVLYVEGFEIKAHLVAGQADRALDLIRRSWGWNLQHPNGTESTFIEGYKTDGSFKYRDDSYSKNGSYTAHSLGWSTGPIDALNSYVVGLRPVGPGGKEWVLDPQFGDLKFAEGGFTLPTGKFSSRWELLEDGFELKIAVPSATSGTVILPLLKGKEPRQVRVDGKKVKSLHKDSKSRSTLSLTGGKHQLSVTC